MRGWAEIKHYFAGIAWVLLILSGSCETLSASDPGQLELLSLDGTWEIVFDHQNLGKANKWHLNSSFSELQNRRDIEVPSPWEVIEKDYEGVAFYRKTFEAPDDWADRIVRIHFGAVNYRAELWLNDEVVGVNEGGFTPFDFRIDEILEPGRTNILILRVLGPLMLSDKVIDGIGPQETPQWRGGLTAGIWQSVSLVATGNVFVEDVFMKPNLSRSEVTFETLMRNTKEVFAEIQVEIDIVDIENGERLSRLEDIRVLRPGSNRENWAVNLSSPKLWSPEHPQLYRAELRILSEGSVSDAWSHRFGMRELTIRNENFELNGEPIYIKAAFFEGLYPNGIAYPDSEKMARREIELAKEAGFNMIRPWRHPPAPMWLDLADEMGVLVVGSPALECMDMPVSTPFLPERVENEVRETILRDRNRTSIVQWELFNELQRPILKQMMRPMALLARELDPTRLILDESGGWAYGANMYLPQEFEPTKFNDIHNYPGPFINERIFDGLLSIGLTEKEKEARGLRGRPPGRNVVPGLMSFVSELGYGSLPDLVENNERFTQNGNPLTPAYRYHVRLADGQKKVLKEAGFEDLYPDLRQFYLDQQLIHGAANKRMIEAVRSNPRVDGYCIHALAAGDWILGAGLLDLWRNPKSYAYEATKAANQPRILPIRVLPRNVYAEKGAEIEIIGVNELEQVAVTLSIRIVKDGTTVWSEDITLDWASGVSQLFREEISTSTWSGSYEVQVTATSSGLSLSQNSLDFNVFSRQGLEVPSKRIAILDLPGTLTPYLDEAGIDYVKFDSQLPKSLPLFVNVGNLSEEKKARLLEVMKFVETGGTAVYLDGLQAESGEESRVAAHYGFPFSARVHPARGLWTCIPHLVHDHAIFEGLPSRGMMRDHYQNVWPRDTLRELDAEAIVASIGFDWFSEHHEMHYSGPGASWWGTDVALVPVGTGRALISQLQIVENLGTDPVADKLLYNMIRFVGE